MVRLGAACPLRNAVTALAATLASFPGCNLGPQCTATTSSTCDSGGGALTLPYLEYTTGTPVRPMGPDGGSSGPSFDPSDFGSLVDVLRTRDQFRARLAYFGLQEADVQEVDLQASKVLVAWEKIGGGWGGIYLQGLVEEPSSVTVEYSEIQYCGDSSDVSSSYYAHFFIIGEGVSVDACGSFWDCVEDSGSGACPELPEYERLIPL